MTAETLHLNVAAEFTPTPGPRKKSEGRFSGEEFLETRLRPKFLAAMNARTSLCVDLDGAAGYPTSFLEEAFGGLAREFGSAEVKDRLILSCNDEPYLIDDIWTFIKNAKTAT